MTDSILDMMQYHTLAMLNVYYICTNIKHTNVFYRSRGFRYSNTFKFMFIRRNVQYHYMVKSFKLTNTSYGVYCIVLKYLHCHSSNKFVDKESL